MKTLKRRKPLQQISKARAKQMAQYQRQKETYLQLNPTCETCSLIFMANTNRKPATDVHHSRGRIGRLLLMEKYWIAVCRPCHDFIHAHPSIARLLGLLAIPGEWNVVPKEDQ